MSTAAAAAAAAYAGSWQLLNNHMCSLDDTSAIRKCSWRRLDFCSTVSAIKRMLSAVFESEGGLVADGSCWLGFGFSLILSSVSSL